MAKQKKELFKILAAAVTYAVLMIMQRAGVIAETGPLPFLLYLIPYIIVGGEVLLDAARNISHGQIFDENFLMCIATFGAFGVEKYSEAVAVMLFFQIGEYFQSRAVNRSRQSISDLMDIYPEFANVERGGEVVRVDPEELVIGDTIVVHAGERVPVDGVVISGESFLDTSALTGESVPRAVSSGDRLFSGCVNGEGMLRVEVTSIFEDSTVAKILELVENASSKKSRSENFITKFAHYYTPIVVIAAALIAVIPPLFMGLGWTDCIRRACTFLVISCPCALVISVPLSFFGGIGAASSIGALVKGSSYLETLANARVFAFDKTGTLTQGSFSVTEILPSNGTDKDALLETAAMAESRSNHPIARSVCDAWGRDIDFSAVNTYNERTGRGIEATINGETILAGNEKLMTENAIDFTPFNGIGTVIYIAKSGAYLGAIVISDVLKPDAKELVSELKSLGATKITMLTGDKKAVGEAVGRELGLDCVESELLPGDKVEHIEKLLADSAGKYAVVYTGDGINDAPVLSRADIGIAMGGIGSDAAIEAADIVIMDDKCAKLPAVIRIARKTMVIVKQNIIFALGVKFLILILGAMGLAGMWLAVFADVGVCVIAILNAMRTLNAR